MPSQNDLQANNMRLRAVAIACSVCAAAEQQQPQQEACSSDFTRVQEWIEHGRLLHPLDGLTSVDLANALAVCAGAEISELDGDVRPTQIRELASMIGPESQVSGLYIQAFRIPQVNQQRPQPSIRYHDIIV